VAAFASQPEKGATWSVEQLFAGAAVTFPFDELNNASRNALSACFR
jgi:hypothetical protein